VEKKNWDPEPEPRQNGTVPQHCLKLKNKVRNVLQKYLLKIIESCMITIFAKNNNISPKNY
jgi:hypothetical protein